MGVVAYFLGHDGVVALVWIVFNDVCCLLEKVVGREV